LSELLYVGSGKIANHEMTEITLAMDFDGFAGDDEAKTGIADP
jgi:hypothetical protein